MRVHPHAPARMPRRIIQENTGTRTRTPTNRRSIVIRQHHRLPIQRTRIISQTLIITRRQMRTILTPPVVILSRRILNPPRTPTNRPIRQLRTRITHTKRRHHTKRARRSRIRPLTTPPRINNPTRAEHRPHTSSRHPHPTTRRPPPLITNPRTMSTRRTISNHHLPRRTPRHPSTRRIHRHRRRCSRVTPSRTRLNSMSLVGMRPNWMTRL